MSEQIRDALLVGRIDEAVAMMRETPSLDLVLELGRFVFEAAQASVLNIRSVAITTYPEGHSLRGLGGLSIEVNDDSQVDELYQVLLARGEMMEAPREISSGSSAWRTADVRIDGMRVTVSSPMRSARDRELDKLKAEIKRLGGTVP